jgi:hypothetical protein
MTVLVRTQLGKTTCVNNTLAQGATLAIAMLTEHTYPAIQASTRLRPNFEHTHSQSRSLLSVYLV